MPRHSLQVGDVVADRYCIEAFIGEGGMGTVYRAHHVRLPRVFALKLLKPALAADPDFVKRFLREAVTASRVIHPNVVNVTDYGQLPDGSTYIAMEHLEGVGLDEEVERLGHLSLERTLDILIQLADALDCCHGQGVLHRDLKTENVILCTVRGRRDVVKLVDFGIAKMLGAELGTWQVTQEGTVFGTPEYLSPEQAMDQDLDARSDLYALGIIAFELVTGRPPFTGRYTEVLKAHVRQQAPPPSSLAAEPLPPAFDALVATLLAKDPAHRFQSGGELLGELLRLRGQTLAPAPGGAGGGEGGGPSGGLPGGRLATGGAWGSLSARSQDSPLPIQAGGAAPTRDELSSSLRAALAAEEVLRQRELVIKELAVSVASRRPSDEAVGGLLGEILRMEKEARSAGEELELLGRQRDELRLEGDEYSRALRLILMDADLRAARSPEDAAAKAVARRLRGHLESLLGSLDERREGLQKDEDACRSRMRELEAATVRRLWELRERLWPLDPPVTDREQRLSERLEHLETMLAHVRQAVR
jgi:serine/threonine-protein kinase